MSDELTKKLNSPADILDAFCNLLSGLKVSTPSLNLTPLECWHIGRKAVDRITELEAQLSDWKALHTAIATGQPIWPNNWSQEVAMLAYEFDVKNSQLEAAKKDAAKWRLLMSGDILIPASERLPEHTIVLMRATTGQFGGCISAVADEDEYFDELLADAAIQAEGKQA